MTTAHNPSDPHGNQPVERLGPALKDAAGAVIMLHGRGATAGDILNLAQAMYHPKLAYLAPQAAGNAWYPQSFLAPREQNEPWLTSAMRKIESVVRIAKDGGIPTERIVICGFSQGACLSSEFVATHPTRYAGVLAFTGGLIGPIDAELNYSGDLLETPVFLGSGDRDPYIPWPRVRQTANVLTAMNAKVTLQCYPGRPHTLSGEEIVFGRQLIVEVFGSARP
jgi:phospholipase/carboxylesterase